MAEDSRDGEVVYVIRADDSGIEGDLEASQRKIEQSTKKAGDKTEKVEKDVSKTVKQEKEDVTRHHKQENEKREKSDEETGKKREDNEKSVSGKIKGILSDTAKDDPVIGAVDDLTGGLGGTALAWAGVGAAAVSVGSMAVSTANEMDKAMNDYMASTGKSAEETDRYQQVLEGIYTNNYGESFQDISDAMSQVDKQLGDMDDSSLQNITESAFALRDTFDYDVSESTRAAKALIDNFGIDGEKAMGLIAAGAQNGLDFSGEMLDSVSEYSTQFEKVGLDADDMFKIFQVGADTGAWNLDKIGDAVKEMGIRVIDGSDTTKEGFETIGLDADEMAEKFAAGGDSAKEAFEQTIDALAGIEDPLAQNTAGVDLFGTMWEDLGPEVVTQLAGIGDEAYATAEDMEALKEVKYDDLTSTMEGLQRNLEMLLVPLGQALIPLLTTLASALLPLITGLLKPILDLFVALLEPILSLINTALQPLIEVFGSLINSAIQPLMDILNVLISVFSEVISGISNNITTGVENIKTIFNSLTDFIKNIFTGNWKGAWENVKTIFKTIADSFKGIWKGPINAIIDMINGFLKGLNNIKIPDWVPGIGGKGFSIPAIPRLKTGIDFVSSDFYPSYLDYGERVLTQEENVRFNAAGGLAGMEQALSRGNYQPTEQRIVLGKGCIVVQSNIDGKTAAQTIAPYMDTELGEVKDNGERNA